MTFAMEDGFGRCAGAGGTTVFAVAFSTGAAAEGPFETFDDCDGFAREPPSILTVCFPTVIVRGERLS